MTTDFDFPFETETIYCENHSDRAAIEHCEICNKALCGYCLYYTVDGQRLCKEHALQAEAQGVQVIPPAVYAAGIIPAQARASESATPAEEGVGGRKTKGAVTGKRVMYQANNNDVMGLVALVVSVIGMSMCCGAGVCLPLVGFFMSILALINAKDAVDTKRTRQQAFIGLGASGLLGLGFLACIGFYAVGIISAFQTNSSFNYYNPTSNPTYYYYLTPSAQPIVTSTPSPTSEPSATETSNTPIRPTKAPSAQPKFLGADFKWWDGLNRIFFGLELAEFD